MTILNNPLVSIIIPTYNSARTVSTLLSSIRKQSYSSIEIIVVDNFSTDSTPEIAKTYGAKVISHRSGRSEARNVGASHAKGRYLFFLDSDLELTPFVVERCVKVCETKLLDGVIIPEKSKGKGFWAECRGLEKLAYINDKHKMSILFMRKDVFDRLGGYDKDLVAGEDYDLNVRFYEAGCKCIMIKDFMYHHEVSSLNTIMRKSYMYGKTLPKYVRKRPVDCFKQFFPIRSSYVFSSKVLLRYPLHAVGLIFLKMLQYFVAFLGILASWFKKRND